MSSPPKILLVDDHLGDIRPLIHHLEWLGYGIDHVANEEAARRALEAVSADDTAYALAIIDIMVSTKDIMDLVDLDASFLEDSQDTGIRLCEYAREQLGISEEHLPIICISARNDDAARDALDALGIPLYGRVPKPDGSILQYFDSNLPKIPRQAQSAD
ncbi:MAG: response regulator transcription factor [bacterium]|nr:response regulator transcription factor [bacterium]